MKKFIVLSIILLMLAGFVITSSANMEVGLYAGKDIYVGKLIVEVVGGDLVVTYDIIATWLLVETHLYVGIDPPTKSAPGQFPYGPGGAVYTIPLTDFSGAAIVYIAAHAVVTNSTGEETAWTGGCKRIPPGKNWATYFKFYIVVA